MNEIPTDILFDLSQPLNRIVKCKLKCVSNFFNTTITLSSRDVRACFVTKGYSFDGNIGSKNET